MAPKKDTTKAASAPKTAPKSATKPASKAASKPASASKSAPKSASKKSEEPRVYTYDGMKYLDKVEWDLNTSVKEAKFNGAELTDEVKQSRLFTEKEQTEMLSGFGNFILINPRAGTKTMTDKDSGKEITANLVASDRVSPRVGVMGLLIAISKMSLSTRGDKFVLKEKSKFAGIEKLACSGDKNTPPIYIVKFK